MMHCSLGSVLVLLLVIVGVSNTQLGPFCGAFFHLFNFRPLCFWAVLCIVIMCQCKYNMYIGGLHIHRYNIYIPVPGFYARPKGLQMVMKLGALDELGRWSSYPIRFGLLCRLWSQACDSCDCGKRVGQTRCQEAP